MRTIKFRGKREDTRKWVFGFLILTHSGKAFIIPEVYQYKVIPETVGQFTGLHDKNGKEIYEGDLIRFLDGDFISSENGRDYEEDVSVGEIGWDDERGGWNVTNKKNVEFDEILEDLTLVEIIGNIYEEETLEDKA